MSTSPSLLELLKSDAAQIRNQLGGRLLPYIFPQFTVVAIYRVAHRLGRAGFPALAELIGHIGLVLTGGGIAWRAEIGPGLYLAHPIGVGIAGGVVAGRNLCVGHSVVLAHGIGESDDDVRSGTPVLGDDVTIWLKASIVGPVRVGDGAIIGAHALVLRDVPDGATARGVPARSYLNGERVG